ncbi:hypothetical protein ACTA71_005704 [Dictyostelium dimigraforme]
MNLFQDVFTPQKQKNLHLLKAVNKMDEEQTNQIYIALNKTRNKSPTKKSHNSSILVLEDLWMTMFDRAEIYSELFILWQYQDPKCGIYSDQFLDNNRQKVILFSFDEEQTNANFSFFKEWTYFRRSDTPAIKMNMEILLANSFSNWIKCLLLSFIHDTREFYKRKLQFPKTTNITALEFRSTCSFVCEIVLTKATQRLSACCSSFLSTSANGYGLSLIHQYQIKLLLIWL